MPNVTINISGRNLEFLRHTQKTVCICCDDVLPLKNETTRQCDMPLLQYIRQACAIVELEPLVMRSFVISTKHR